MGALQTSHPTDAAPPSYESFWAGMKELRESQEKTDRQMEETDRRMKETQKLVAELSKNVGGLNNTVGALMETLFAARLWEKFPEYRLRLACQRVKVLNDDNKAIDEIDILLLDTEWTIAVEVKREAEKRDIDDHVAQMQHILQYPPSLIKPQSKLLGAIAGGVVPTKVAAYAHECGFMVLELAGESVVRLPGPPGFTPKIFT